MQSSPARGKDQISQFITFVKAVAILQIVFWHFEDARYFEGFDARPTLQQISSMIFSHDFSESVAGLISAFTHNVGIAVSAFFMASGYGLYLSYLKKRPSWAGFYKKRAIRVLPLYWAAVIAVYFWRTFRSYSDLKGLFSAMLLLQNFTPDYLDYGALWFVGVLVWFYIAFPLFVKAFSHDASKWALVILSLAANYLAAKALDAAGVAFSGKLPFEYLPYFTFGMLTADWVFHDRKILAVLFSLRGWAAISVALAASLAARQYLTVTLDISAFQSIAYFFVLYIPSTLINRFGPARRAVSFIAYASFITFLFHQVISQVLYYEATRLRLVGLVSIGNGPLRWSSSGELSAFMVICCVAVISLSYAVQASYDRLIAKTPLLP